MVIFKWLHDRRGGLKATAQTDHSGCFLFPLPFLVRLCLLVGMLILLLPHQIVLAQVASATPPKIIPNVSPKPFRLTSKDALTHSDVDALLRHIDNLWRGQTSHANMSMTVKTRRYQRTMSLEAWSMGAERSLVVIRQPKKDRGVATLKVDANIWNYLPRIDRVTKVPSSMMSGAWMGSHFTNDDLVKESTFSEDYTAKQMPLTASGASSGKDSDKAVEPASASVIYIRALPKPDAHVVWGRVDIWIDARAYYPKKIVYFDESEQPVRTLRFDQIEIISGRSIPMRLRLQPEAQPMESTEIIYHKIAFDVTLTPTFFSLQNLKNRY